MRNKKSMGASFYIVVAAALALIVLVVLGVIFGSNMKIFTKTTTTCDGRGGKCANELNGKCNDDYPIKIYTKDCEDKDGCCLPLVRK